MVKLKMKVISIVAFLVFWNLITFSNAVSHDLNSCEVPIGVGQQDCGITEPWRDILDLRLQLPWTAAIFLRGSKDSSQLVYHTSAAIIGPTTVLTVFAGIQTKLPRKIRGRHTTQTPELAIVAGGLKSANLSETDEHAQFAEVSFIEPFQGPEEHDKEYHFVMVHLKTPFDFGTPYIRPICLPPRTEGVTNGADKYFLQGGFSGRKHRQEDSNSTMWDIDLKAQNVTSGTGYECVKNFEHFFERTFPAGMFCSKQPQGDISSDFSCLLHGSAIVVQKGSRWYLNGLTALIRGRKGGFCKQDTVYFNTRLSTMLDWIHRSLRCSPFSFSCLDGTCHPLEDVCNSMKNCIDGSDESEVLCESNNRCSWQLNMHQCNLEGHCISVDDLCDGKPDCDGGTDESPQLCDRDEAINRNMRHTNRQSSLKIHCPPLSQSEGTVIKYTFPVQQRGATISTLTGNCSWIPIGTVATVGCKDFYKPESQAQSESRCNENGKWNNNDFERISCHPDCGMVNQKFSVVKQGSVDLYKFWVLPWHALIFQKNGIGFKFVCGATLIDTQFFISAANCFTAPLENFRLVLGAVSKNYTENLKNKDTQIVSVNALWWPDGYNRTTSENLFNIAVVRSVEQVTCDSSIRPACYPPIITDPLAIKRSQEKEKLHVAEFPIVAEIMCLDRQSFPKSHGMFECVGIVNDTKIYQKESGGGMFGLARTRFGTRYVLQGIMSHSGSEFLTYFTPIEKHRSWITNILGKK